MAASTVTGKGQGAAYNQKGPGNGRNFNVPEVNPHVIAAGIFTGGTGGGVIHFPQVLDATAIAVNVTPTVGQASTDLLVTKGISYISGISQLLCISVTATGLTGFDYTLVKTGFGLDVTNGI